MEGTYPKKNFNGAKKWATYTDTHTSVGTSTLVFYAHS